jgi:hypothetical protein
MSQTQLQDPPLLGPLLDRVVKRLPYEVARAMADAPPIEAGADDPIGELTRMLQTRCRRRIDEPEFNEETRQTLRDAREGKGLTRCNDLNELFGGRGA